MVSKVFYKLNKKNFFEYIVIKGHANYAEIGQDIVCSAISAITNGAVNFIGKNYQNDCQISYLDSELVIYPKTYNKDCHLCLQLMLYQLENIVNYYPKYLKINQKK